MNNSAISRSSQQKNAQKETSNFKKLSQLDSKNGQKKQVQQQVKVQPLIDKVEVFPPSEESSGLKTNYLKQRNSKNLKLKDDVQQNSISTPLFKRFRKQQQFFQPNSYDDALNQEKQNRLKNQFKEGSLKMSQRISFGKESKDTLEIHSRESLDSKEENKSAKNLIQKQKTQNVGNKILMQPKAVDLQTDKNNSHDFGIGLEGITDKINEQQSGQQIRETGKFQTQSKENKSKSAQRFHSSTFSPLQSSISGNNRFTQNRMSSAQFYSACNNSYKRSTISQQCFKTPNFYKNQKRESNSTINLYKQGNTKSNLSQQSRPVSRERSDIQQCSRNSYFQIIADAFKGTMSGSLKKQKVQKLKLSFANNLKRILFKYNGGHASTLYHYGLKIKNESTVPVQVKIKCNSPRHYQVRPCSNAILKPSQIMCVSIQMKLYPHDLDPKTMKHDLSRYNGDKFMIVYQPITELHSVLQFQDELQKLLPVVIQQTDEFKLRNQKQRMNLDSERQRMATQQKQIQMYKKLIDRNNLRVSQIDQKIQKLQTSEFYLKHISKHVFVFGAFLGISIGLWLG